MRLKSTYYYYHMTERMMWFYQKVNIVNVRQLISIKQNIVAFYKLM